VGTAQDVLVYFGGETIQEGTYGSTLSLSYVTADRLGSMPGGAKLDPYGQEISATANDKIKFATYLRDGESGIDYAMNRLYAAGRGRFLSADPVPGHPANPQSLNLYTYAADDPVNRYDPNGAFSVCAGIMDSDDSMDECSADPSPVMYPAAGTVQGWDDFHGRPHPTGTASLDALVDVGVITGWSFVNGNRDQLSLSFQAQTAPIAIGVCVAQPELCVVVGGVISITVMWPELKEVLSAIQHQITSRDAAPVKYNPYDAGRDENGHCKPVDPEKKVKWKGTGGDHWHWIEWNQTKDCMTYPKYQSGPDPGPDYQEISR
jgi:RHS repeat-associated protein